MTNVIGIMPCSADAEQHNVGLAEDIRDLSLGIYGIPDCHEYVLVPNWVGGL